jgi:hypothetical protein
MMVPPLLALVLYAPPPRAAPRTPPRPARPPTTRPVATAPAIPLLRVDLTAAGSTGEARATGQPGRPPPERLPELRLPAGERPALRIQVMNLDPRRATGDVAVRLRVRRRGETLPEGAPQPGVLDTIIGTSIGPLRTVRGDHNTPLDAPGTYLVELEVLSPEARRLQYCALEVRVE